MRRRRFLGLAAALPAALALGGCAGLFGRGEVPREIVVDLPVSRSEAVRRTAATFRVQGYTIRDTPTSGTRPETESFRHRDAADAVFRAVVTGSTRRSRVVFSGSYRTRDLGGLVRGRERPVQRGDDELERELWARLDNLAIMLRRGGGS